MDAHKRRKPQVNEDLGLSKKNSGGVLLSHKNDLAVPLALEGLTSEFGMGSGVAPPVLPPETDERYELLTSTD